MSRLCDPHEKLGAIKMQDADLTLYLASHLTSSDLSYLAYFTYFTSSAAVALECEASCWAIFRARHE